MTEIQAKVMDIAEKYIVDFKLSKGQVIAKTCPFCGGGDHNDQNTFAIGLYNGAYNCKRGSCGAKGNINQLCAHFGESCQVTNDYANILKNSPVVTKKKYALPDPSILMPLTDEALSYFASRMISEDTLNAYHVSCDKNGNIVFPFYRDSQLVYTKFRVPKKYIKNDNYPKEWAGKDQESILFGMDMVDFDKPLYITEGMIDALSLYEAGIRNVCSVPSGCQNMDWVLPAYSWLEKFNQIVLFGDIDDPGRQMVDKLSKRIGEEKCMIPPEYPEAILTKEDGTQQDFNKLCKDANEILYFYGPDKLAQIANNCQNIPIVGLLDLADVRSVDPTTIDRIYTRIPMLDDMIGGLAPGTVTVFTGKRGEGKSTFNGQLMLNAIDQGHKVCAYSGELPASRFLEWTMLQATNKEYVTVTTDKHSGKMIPIVPDNVGERVRQWLRGKFFLFDNSVVFEESQTKSILRIFGIAAKKFGCDVFLIDNMMIALCNGQEEETKAQAKFAAELKTFATKFQARVILVAHPRKTMGNNRINNDDVSGSSAITNLADTVITVEKPNLNVIKNREFGDTGTVVCNYSKVNRRIYQQDQGDTFDYKWNHVGIEEPQIKAMSFTNVFPEQIGRLPDNGNSGCAF